MDPMSSSTSSISPQFHNFVFLSISFFLFVWVVKTLLRMRSLYELHRALKSYNVIRLAGYRQLTNLTRETLTTMLRSRSGHVREEVNRIDVKAHLSKSSAKLENGSGDFFLLKFAVDKLQPEQKINVDVYLGVPFNIARKIQNKQTEKADQANKKKPKKKIILMEIKLKIKIYLPLLYLFHFLHL